jgi:hypothetical protein
VFILSRIIDHSDPVFKLIDPIDPTENSVFKLIAPQTPESPFKHKNPFLQVYIKSTAKTSCLVNENQLGGN